MTGQELLEMTAKATLACLSAEKNLFDLSVNERSLTHKLAEYLQPYFREWNVDCEYNRLGAHAKKLPVAHTVRTDDTGGKTIYPDIIIHKRGSRENLVVVEVKKSTNKTIGDDHKLKGLTLGAGDYGYELGLHLVIDCETPAIQQVTCYTNGTVDAALSDVAKALFILNRQ